LGLRVQFARLGPSCEGATNRTGGRARAHVPYFGAFGVAWVDAMVPRWSVNPLGMLYRLSCLMLTVTQETLPAGKSIGGGGSDEGKPGDGDRVPGRDKKRGIVRTLGGVKGGRNATCRQSRDRPC
jgi:hypothetical protein